MQLRNPETKWQGQLAAFGAGLLFACGLGISGMTAPAKVLGFLDLAGAWDPSLALVMIGAIGVHGVAQRLIRKRKSPLFGGVFELPKSHALDAKLLGGAALFGIGWGLGGYCPGPALVSAATGQAAPLVLVAAMTVGMLARYFTSRTPAQD